MLTAMAGSKTAETTGQPQAPVRRERQLVERFIRGDDSAFDEIVAAYQGRVAGLAYRLLGWPGDVEDVTQDVFLAAYLGLKKFRCKSSLKTWLFTITINKCRSYRYKRMLRAKLLRQSADKEGSVSVTDSRLMDKERFGRICRALTAMAAKYREPMVLKYLEELSTEKICEILGITRNRLNVRLSRARGLLREKLADLLETD